MLCIFVPETFCKPDLTFVICKIIYYTLVVVTAEKDDQLSLVREQAQKEIEEVKAENDRMQQREADLRVCGMEKASNVLCAHLILGQVTKKLSCVFFRLICWSP